MIVGERLKQIREMKQMSQGDIEKKTGLLRCYLSRCENGHTVPSIETLEKWVHAMDVPLYQLFFEPKGHAEPQLLKLPKKDVKLSGKDANVIARLTGLVSHMDERDKKLLVAMAHKFARRR